MLFELGVFKINSLNKANFLEPYSRHNNFSSNFKFYLDMLIEFFNPNCKIKSEHIFFKKAKYDLFRAIKSNNY
ncbi:hypothetical protein BpHYR1_052877 [Brachionus plicatilis]|uniref:Uncharacterized protein n=1 Tax=Brachionus plicatilis TaxID=10195 RepID=A0A3M7RJ09_BRAPC|nr:hypothetical protein BpHYR1_052877 [Brachionus plicatilis]